MNLDNKIMDMKQRGFTLIELLIVVAIIGILSTLLMTNFIGVRQRARDAQRKADLRQIQSALELYRSDQGTYLPVQSSPYQIDAKNCPVPVMVTPDPGYELSSGTTVYMQTVPCDPLGTTVFNGGNYFYFSNGNTYTLAACAENTSDPQAQTSVTLPANPSSTCGSGYYFVFNNP